MLNALIVDDEALARDRLRSLLNAVAADRLRIAGEAGDGVEALGLLEEQAVDVLFLDIQMPELSGFDVLERLAPAERPAVVFTTAYDRYALRAFEANAVDYLLKPITKDRLSEAVDRAERMRSSAEGQRLSAERLEKLARWIETQEARPVDRSGDSAGAAAEKKEADYPAQLSVEHHDRIHVVSVPRIVCVEINDGITRLYEQKEGGPDERPGLRQHVVDYTLDHLESTLDPAAFMRVHRSALVQIRYIEEMIPWFSGRYKLVLRHGHEVIASRERSKTLRDRLSI